MSRTTRPTLLRPASLALALKVALGAAACGMNKNDNNDASTKPAAASYPIELTNCDQPLSIAEPIEKAVAISQPAVELLLSLGLGDRMIAYGMSDANVMPHLADELAKSKPFAGDKPSLATEYPSFETLLDLEPDFVYGTFNYTFTPEGIAERAKFDQMGIATYQSPSECGGQEADRDRQLTLEDQYAEITDLATLFDVPDKGEKLIADLKEQVADALPDNKEAYADVKLAWWYAATKAPYMAGCCGAPALMTDAVGAQNAFGDQSEYWPEIGWEAILDADPDVLVLADLGRGDDGDSADAKLKFLESDPVASKLTAVREKRFIILDGTTMDPSIRNVNGIADLAAGLEKLGYNSAGSAK